MSFLKSLFGGNKTDSAKDQPQAETVLASESYNGYTVKAMEMRAGSEYQLAGRIEKDLEGAHKQVEFIRADKFSSADDASAATLRKGRQIIDEQGAGVFGG